MTKSSVSPFQKINPQEWQRLQSIDRALNQNALVWIRNQEGYITYMNDNACKVTGYDREQLHHRVQFFHKKDYYPEHYVHRIFEYVREHHSWQGEVLCESSSGDAYWLDVTTTPVSENAQPIDQFVSIAHVISDRKQTESTLLRFEKGLRAITALQSDTSLSFQDKAQQALEMISRYLSTDEAVFLYPLEVSHSATHFGLYSTSTALAHGDLKHYLQWAAPLLEDTTGSLTHKVWTLSADSPFQQIWGLNLFSSQNENMGCLAFFNTTSQPLALSTEKHEFFELFTQWFCSLIERENFLQFMKESNASKDRLMTILAHDLRSPLSAVSGFTELLLDSATQRPTEPLSQHLEMIQHLQEASQRSLLLIQSILEFERLGKDAYLPNFEKICLNDWLNKHLKVPLMQADRYLLSTTIQLPATSLYVQLDEPIFARVMSNLLHNACKFTPSGGEITIQLEETLLGEERMAHLEIIDTGIGIPESQLKFLFSRDAQVRRPGLRGEASNGMGLSIAQRIIDLHKGYLRIESEENRGTCVSIMLPLS